MLQWLISLLSGFSFIVLSAADGQNFPPPISSAEEKEYFRLMAEGDTSARLRLIEHNLRLVSHIVRKYYGSKGSSEELLSIGCVGLIKAVDTFNSANGARFGTYASRCIQNEILMHFRSLKKQSLEVSMDEAVDMDRDGNPLTYMDIIRCEDTIADDIDRNIRTLRALSYIRDNLSDRDRKIIVMRYGLDGNDPLTQRETAEIMGISRSYVSRIEKTVLEEMRGYLS